MSENQYPNVGNEPLLGNYQAPPPPPPPPQNNPYNVPNANPYNAPNANPYNVPNANPYNAPNPSFHNNQNPSFHNNPNPSFNNANMQPIYRPGNAPYNQGQVVASVGNHQVKYSLLRSSATMEECTTIHPCLETPSFMEPWIHNAPCAGEKQVALPEESLVGQLGSGVLCYLSSLASAAASLSALTAAKTQK